MMKQTRQYWAQQAIDVQNACNLSGVLHSFVELVQWLRESDEDLGTDGIRYHPLVVMFGSKINGLTGYEQKFGEAYVQVCEWAADEEGCSLDEPDDVCAVCGEETGLGCSIHKDAGGLCANCDCPQCRS